MGANKGDQSDLRSVLSDILFIATESQIISAMLAKQNKGLLLRAICRSFLVGLFKAHGKIQGSNMFGQRPD